jgi:hypothetical protein
MKAASFLQAAALTSYRIAAFALALCAHNTVLAVYNTALHINI